eukprot:TRINITY_DN16605_c0_g1_i1.p1 TRINITY_DN16605_c0_g1~~TRINITY_DN16605_c0_g1_i1.p1  ORF type:complete len:409 (+),score=117.84 TRINITY_DN16605_c0_g1_i1:87-1229(+)
MAPPAAARRGCGGAPRQLARPRRGFARSAALLEIAHQRPLMCGRPVAEQLNQYNPANPRFGTRPYGHAPAKRIEEFRLRYRQKLPNDELNPAHGANWRKYEMVPRENTHNPDSFFYEHYVNGARAYQQVFLEDVLRLMEYPEEGIQVVDVRSSAAKLTHHLPFSVRIPHEELDYALQLPPEGFFQMYAFHAPQPGCELICVSHDGVASEKALRAFERWGYPDYTLFNFRGGCNELFAENFSDWDYDTEHIPAKPWESVGMYPLRPDWLEQIGPVHSKYTPYPDEDLDKQKAVDDSGEWDHSEPKGGVGQGPVGAYVRQKREYMQQIDGQWLRSRLLSDVEFYDRQHRELPSRWREPDLTLDRAWKPGTFRTNQFWRTQAH